MTSNVHYMSRRWWVYILFNIKQNAVLMSPISPSSLTRRFLTVRGWCCVVNPQHGTGKGERDSSVSSLLTILGSLFPVFRKPGIVVNNNHPIIHLVNAIMLFHF